MMDAINKPTEGQLHPYESGLGEFGEDEEIVSNEEIDESKEIDDDGEICNNEEIDGDNELEEEMEDDVQQSTVHTYSCRPKKGQFNPAQNECHKLLHSWRSKVAHKRNQGMKGKKNPRNILPTTKLVQIASAMPTTNCQLKKSLGRRFYLLARDYGEDILNCVYQATSKFPDTGSTSLQNPVHQHKKEPNAGNTSQQHKKKSKHGVQQQKECSRLLKQWVKKIMKEGNVEETMVLRIRHQKEIANALPRTKEALLNCCTRQNIAAYAQNNMDDILQCVSRAIERFPEVKTEQQPKLLEQRSKLLQQQQHRQQSQQQPTQQHHDHLQQQEHQLNHQLQQHPQKHYHNFAEEQHMLHDQQLQRQQQHHHYRELQPQQYDGQSPPQQYNQQSQQQQYNQQSQEEQYYQQSQQQQYNQQAQRVDQQQHNPQGKQQHQFHSQYLSQPQQQNQSQGHQQCHPQQQQQNHLNDDELYGNDQDNHHQHNKQVPHKDNEFRPHQHQRRPFPDRGLMDLV